RPAAGVSDQSPRGEDPPVVAGRVGGRGQGTGSPVRRVRGAALRAEVHLPQHRPSPGADAALPGRGHAGFHDGCVSRVLALRAGALLPRPQRRAPAPAAPAGRCRRATRAWASTARKTRAPPARVVRVGTSPTPNQTQSGASTS